MNEPVSIPLIVALCQIASMIVAAVWVVAAIRSKTRELARSIETLADTITRLDTAVEKLDDWLLHLDRRVTRIEAGNGARGDGGK